MTHYLYIISHNGQEHIYHILLISKFLPIYFALSNMLVYLFIFLKPLKHCTITKVADDDNYILSDFFN